MREDIDSVLLLLDAARHRIRQLAEKTKQYEGKEVVWAQVDLGHAEYELNRAIGFVNRLILNGKKPWDEEVQA